MGEGNSYLKNIQYQIQRGLRKILKDFGLSQRMDCFYWLGLDGFTKGFLIEFVSDELLIIFEEN